MRDNIQHFLEIAKKNLARYCFMVWDYFYTPNVFQVEVIDSTLRCTYGPHNLINGKINPDIFSNIDDRGEVVITADLEWMPTIEEHFTDLKLLDPSMDENSYNSFLCMELSKKDFQAKEGCISRRLDQDDQKLVSMNRKIHLNSGVGGVGIIEDRSLVACAFAPHVVMNESFSFAILRDIWTRPSYRGKGFGYDVSSRICDIAFEEGVEKIFLWVEENNKAAVNIYEKIGFITANKAYSVIGKKKKSNANK
ncbi:MAG: GNAT family N-acetyltransferase [Candidatus Heimdallarchaeota archaeon]|nr:GNAT family N-acetyltransferase [Candidatus Heimdallarchaeota archaeon]